MAGKVDLTQDIEKFAERWSLDPKSRVFAQLADAYRKAGMLEEAIQVCLEGLRDHPNYASARVVLGRAYLEKGALSEAEAEFLRVIELSPDNLLAHRTVGEIYQRQGRWAEALVHYQTVLDLNPFDREVKELLAELEASKDLSGEGRVPAEEKVLEKEAQPQAPLSFLERGPLSEQEEVLATETLGDLYLQQGHRDRSIQIFELLLAKDPTNEALRQKLEGLRFRESVSPRKDPSPSEASRGEVEVLRVLEGWLVGLRRARRSKGDNF